MANNVQEKASTPPQAIVYDGPTSIESGPDSWLERIMASYAEKRRIIKGLGQRLDALEARTKEVVEP